MSANKMPVDERPVNKMSVDEMPVDEMYVDKCLLKNLCLIIK